jgi:hypothetical protein
MAQTQVKLNDGKVQAQLQGNRLILTFDLSEKNWTLSSTGKREVITSGGKVQALGYEINAMAMRLPKA